MGHFFRAGVAEALHEVGDDIMVGTLAVEVEHGTLLLASDVVCAPGTEHFGTNIIAIKGVTANFDVADRASFVTDIDNAIINITNCPLA